MRLEGLNEPRGGWLAWAQVTPVEPHRGPGLDARPSPALLVDLYELTMAEAYWRREMAERPATFSLFLRRLPRRRGFLVAAGLDDCLTWLEQLRFGPAELEALGSTGLFAEEFLAWLAQRSFTGSVRAVAEGTVVFADEPLIEVEAPMAEAQLAETYLLNQITLQTSLATKAARCLHAAAGRPVVDFALRRTQGVDAGMKLARVGRLVGLAGTSNVAGALAYGMAPSGTVGHSFIQAFESETEAFRALASIHGDRAVLLVDTYDTLTGIDRAVAVARERRESGGAIRGIRIDSGDLAGLASHARRRLDAAGLGDVAVLVSGGLDEHAIAELVGSGAPVDGFGVGSALGVSADAPTLDSVYKLVAFDGRAVHKTSPGKRTWPGAKQVWRAADFSADVLALAGEPSPGPGHRPLLVEVMSNGKRTPAGEVSLDRAGDHFREQWRLLPEDRKHLTDPVAHRVEASTGLVALAASLEEDPHDARSEGGGST